MNQTYFLGLVESRMVVEVNLLHRFEGKSYTEKVTKAFPETPSGYGATTKRSVWGKITPP